MLRISARYTLDDDARFRDVRGRIYSEVIWYLATPYSNYPHGRDGAYADAVSILGSLAARGITAYSPIVHWHDVAKLHAMPTDAGFWRKTNETYMRRCYGALIAELPGWSESVGVRAEIDFFQHRDKTVHHLPVRPIIWDEQA